MVKTVPVHLVIVRLRNDKLPINSVLSINHKIECAISLDTLKLTNNELNCSHAVTNAALTEKYVFL